MKWPPDSGKGSEDSENKGTEAQKKKSPRKRKVEQTDSSANKNPTQNKEKKIKHSSKPTIPRKRKGKRKENEHSEEGTLSAEGSVDEKGPKKRKTALPKNKTQPTAEKEELSFKTRGGKKANKPVCSIYDPDYLSKISEQPEDKSVIEKKEEPRIFFSDVSIPEKESKGEDKNKETKHGVLVIISVPYKEKLEGYKLGHDRDPMTLIMSYMKAVCPDAKNIEDLIKQSSGKLKIVLCVNLRNDHSLSAEVRNKKIEKMSQWVNEINNILNEKNFPAVLIKGVWAPNKPNSKPILKTEQEVLEASNFLDELGKKTKEKLRFGFATTRTYTMQHPKTHEMITELFHENDNVMVMTGDADLVGLNSVNNKRSVIDFYFKHLAKTSNVPIRMGGAYRFDPKEIASHLQSYKDKDVFNEGDLGKSVLITYLAKTLDTATRKLVSKFEGVPYFAEPNTLISLAAFSKAYFMDKQKRGLLELTFNENLAGDPDWTQKHTTFASNSRNWTEKAKHKIKGQPFFAQMEAQLVSSSRHDLVVYTSSSKSFMTAKKIKKEINQDKTQIMNPKLSTIENMRSLKNHHNTQIKPSQLNSRFKEAGYGDTVIHAIMHGMHNILPFTYSFWFNTDPKINLIQYLGGTFDTAKITLPPPLPFNYTPQDNADSPYSAMNYLINCMNWMSQSTEGYLAAFSGSLQKEAFEKLIREVRSLSQTMEFHKEEKDKLKEPKTKTTGEKNNSVKSLETQNIGVNEATIVVDEEKNKDKTKRKKQPKYTDPYDEKLLKEEPWDDLLQTLVEIELLFRWGSSVFEYIVKLDPKFTPDPRNEIHPNEKEILIEDDFSFYSENSLSSAEQFESSDSLLGVTSGQNKSEHNGEKKQFINTTRWYSDADISLYVQTAIQHRLGDFKREDNGFPYHFLLKNTFPETDPWSDYSNEKIDYKVAVTPAILTKGGPNLPITYFFDKNLQAQHPVSEILEMILNRDHLKILKSILETSEENEKFANLKEHIETISKHEDIINTRIVHELVNARFSSEILKIRMQELNKYSMRKDVFDEIIPELYPTEKEPKEGLHIKIIFPYNLDDEHWRVGEIKIHKNSHKYCIELFSHDPFGYGEMNTSDFENIKQCITNKIKNYDADAIFEFLPKKSGYTKRQNDSDSCGVIAAEEVLMRIQGEQLNSIYDPGAIELRRQQIDLINMTLEKDDPSRMLFVSRNTFSSTQYKESVKTKTPGYFGYKSLHELVESGDVDSLAALFLANKQGINLNTKNNNGQTCLHIAAALGNVQILSLLTDYEKQHSQTLLNLRDSIGNTPLHIAAFYGNKEAAIYLCKSGTNANLKNIYEEDCNEAAKLGGHPELIPELQPYQKTTISLGLKNVSDIEEQKSKSSKDTHNSEILAQKCEEISGNKPRQIWKSQSVVKWQTQNFSKDKANSSSLNHSSQEPERLLNDPHEIDHLPESVRDRTNDMELEHKNKTEESTGKRISESNPILPNFSPFRRSNT